MFFEHYRDLVAVWLLKVVVRIEVDVCETFAAICTQFTRHFILTTSTHTLAANMLGIGSDYDVASEKCYVTQCVLPQYIDQSQPPTKRKPFSTIFGHPFNHTVCYILDLVKHVLMPVQLDLLLPKDVFENLRESLLDDSNTLQYAKVHLKLKDIVEGKFFNQYIKTGTVLDSIRFDFQAAADSHRQCLDAVRG